MLAILYILCVPFAFVESFSANVSLIDISYNPNDGWIDFDFDTSEIKLLKDITEDAGFKVKYEFDKEKVDDPLEENEVDLCGVDESSVDGQMVRILLTALGVEGSCPIAAQNKPEVKHFTADLNIDDEADPNDCKSSWSMTMFIKSPKLKDPVVEIDFFIENNDCDYKKSMEDEGAPNNGETNNSSR